jgi:uncharacterized protein YybS (DUF2232 family)
METPPAMQNEAVNVCVCARATFAAAGEMEFVAEHVMVTLALADFAVSATLVAVTFTVAGDGGAAGATYSALSAPFETTVPSVELPPEMPFTLHVTAVDGLPGPDMLAVNACPAPVEIVAEMGEMATTMSSFTVTTDDAVTSDSALLEAVTVTLADTGIVTGAVYKPAEEIVPALAFPPATPPANHVMLVFDAPVTLA